MLRDVGYNLYHMPAPQLGTGKDTRMKILTHPDNDWKTTHDAMVRGEIQNVTSKSDDGGLTFTTPKLDPDSVSSKQLQVRYGPEGPARSPRDHIHPAGFAGSGPGDQT